MILNGVDFGRLWNSSGARGFFGDPDEYWYHKYWHMLGLDYTGYTFVAKTTTLLQRTGNMPLDGRWRPRELRPKCIVVKPAKGVVLNAVGLSGPGLASLLSTDKWQNRREPFVISYMPDGEAGWELRANVKTFAHSLGQELLRFRSPVALEINFSCPNVDHGSNHPDQVCQLLDIMRDGGVTCPLIPKFNALEPIQTAVEVAKCHNCDAVAVGNTIPWGRVPELIDWVKLFGTDISPLLSIGGGGLSGSPLLPLTVGWVSKARHLIDKPIIAGGGVLSARDALTVMQAGADILEVGVVGMLRPWNMRSIKDAVCK